MVAFTRGIDPTLLAEFQKDLFFPIVLAKVDWPGGVVRIHSGLGDLTFNSEVYSGSGELGSLTVGEESLGYVPQEATISLISSIESILADQTADAEGRRVDIWIGATTKPGGTTLVGTPYLSFVGGVSSDDAVVPNQSGLEDFDLDNPHALMVGVKAGTHGRVKGSISHTDEDQKTAFPGDTLFERTARASAYRAAPPKW